MIDNLYPTFDATSITVEEDIIEESLADIVAPQFNTEKGVFTRNTIGQVLIGDAEGAYRFWVIKCLLTERYKYLAYDSDFGVEIEEILRSDYPREVAESEIERTIKEALIGDTRTVSVGRFMFEWKGDSLALNFLVESVYGEASYQYQRGGDGVARVQAA